MSPRPKNIRKVRGVPAAKGFTPDRQACPGRKVVLYIEEYEAIYMCDYEGKKHEEAAASMGISRPTLTRIYASARKKIAEAIIEGCRLVIDGGSSYMDAKWFRCSRCGMIFGNAVPRQDSEDGRCPLCGGACDCIEYGNINQTIYNKMRKIALPTRNGFIDDHFGHCEFYTVLTVNDENKIVASETIPSPQGCGCKSNIAFKFQEDGVTVMLAGNMGPGAVNKLSSCGIKVIRGCQGPVMDVAQAYLRGEIQDSGETCSHHGGEGHQCHHDSDSNGHQCHGEQ